MVDTPGLNRLKSNVNLHPQFTPDPGLKDLPFDHLHIKKTITDRVFQHADREASLNYVAFTFDDGPNPNFTPKILDVLKKCNCKATFFVVGKYVKLYPELTRRILQEGHTLGNHTYYHTHHAKDYEECGRIVANVTGYIPLFLRAPFYEWEHTTYMDDKILIGAERDSLDYRGVVGEADMFSNIMPLESGSIIIFHDGFAVPAHPESVENGLKHRAENTLAALPSLIMDVRNNRFEPVPLSRMTFGGRYEYNES